MTASVQKKRGKLYIVLSWEEEGKRRQKWVSTGLDEKGNLRKAEALRNEVLNEYREKLEGNKPSQAKTLSLEELTNEWLEAIRLSVEPTTLRTYENFMRFTVVPALNKQIPDITNIDVRVIQQYINKRYDEGLSPSTVMNYCMIMSSMFRYAKKVGYIDTNPIERINVPKRLPVRRDLFTAEDLNLLITHTRGTKIETQVFLAAWYGLRKGEVTGLQWKDVDFVNKTITVNGSVITIKTGDGHEKEIYRTHCKTPTSMRTLPLMKPVEEYLVELKKRQESNQIIYGDMYCQDWLGFLCVDKKGKLIKLNAISTEFSYYVKQLGLPKLRFHDLRHANASLLLRNGMPMKAIQIWLGHSRMQTTSDRYAHLYPEAQRELGESLEKTLMLGNPNIIYV